MIKSRSFLVFPMLFTAALLIFTSCGVIVKHYPANKPFVYKTNIIIKGEISNDTAEILVSKLKGQLDDSMQSRSVAKLVVSVMKNPPLYDSVNAEKTVVYMYALMNSLGYFRDTITYDTVVKRVNGDQLRTTVNFRVKPGRVTRFDSIYYGLDTPLRHSNQRELQALAVGSLKNSTIKKMILLPKDRYLLNLTGSPNYTGTAVICVLPGN